MLQLFLGGFPLGELFSREAKRVFKPRTFCLPKDQDTLSREKSRLVENRLYTQRTKKYKIADFIKNRWYPNGINFRGY